MKQAVLQHDWASWVGGGGAANSLERQANWREQPRPILVAHT
ncbi:MAG: hypothetical protein VKK04_03435 [Synechococcales bacterium]|nr:hypothetical protein [Synechococcales bacterium]